ncbi:hypothetical protein CVT24_007242 [Panaeolus cyanescens]|uniref:F-box domain-containing protein n=1 Tax=Panaeolus cyanescens TaxID=181874 RepID=A0A409YPC1_9AGAR|nr:hypothetical protein CVT24_007242 [Panaeolus cyanescens]
MSSVIETIRKTPIPNDIVCEIINILATEQTLDYDSEDSDTELEQPPEEPHDPPGRMHVKVFHTLSSFCLHHSRRHIFAQVNLKTFSNTEDWTHANRPPKHLPTLKHQLAFFAEHTGTLPYIRHLYLSMGPEEFQDSSLQAQLHDVMVQLSNLEILEIDFNYLNWSDNSLSTARSIRSGFRNLLRSSQTLTEVHLFDLINFCVNDLVDASSLQCLDLDDTSLVMDDDSGARMVINSLRHLGIHPCPENTDFEHFVKFLTARDEDGNLVLTFPDLEALHFEVGENSELPGVLKIVTAHGGSLDKLSLEMFVPGKSDIPRFILPNKLKISSVEQGNNDRSAWFNEVILPRSQTLRIIEIEAPINREGQDPFAGICSTILRMNQHSVLTRLDITIRVQPRRRCTLGDEWLEFSKALETNRNLKSLRRVSLVVNVEEDPDEPSNGSLQRALDGLRETHLKSLFSQSFKFEYRVRTIIL